MREAEQGPGVAEKIAYALGDSASSFYWKSFEFFVVFYYTDVFGLSAASVGTMLLATRIGDAIADPFMGAIADQTHTRWGRFRPWLLWCCVPLAAAGVITFTTPAGSYGVKLFYAYITYSFLMICYTAINIPYTALMGVLTSDSRQRTSVSSWRFALAFLVTIFVQKFTVTFVKTFGNGNDSLGWQRTMILYGVLAVAMFLICFAMTRERVPPLKWQSPDALGSIAAVLTSVPWRILFVSVALILSSYGIRGAASAYYFKYCLHREDLLGWFLTANGVSTLLGIVCAPVIANAIGKKGALVLCCSGGALAFSSLMAARPSSLFSVFAIQIISSFVIGPIAPLFFAMFADVADYAEWRTRRRQTGLFFASAMFSIKLGAAIGGWMLGMILSLSGYVPNAAQTTASLRAISLAMSILPGVLLAIAGSILAGYELNEPQVLSIQTELRERRLEA